MSGERLSLNQITIEQCSLPEAVAGCARAGIRRIGLWRHKVAEAGVAASARLVRDAGLTVSSLCRGGMFPAATVDERRRRLDDNRRAIEEAAALGTDLLVLVCGGLPDRDIAAARQMVAEAIAQLLPEARASGVRLGIEPLHPMFAADRSVITTLGEANALAERLASPWVGVVIDTYHVWWDPQVYPEIARAQGRILGFHVNDWIVPLTDPLHGRGMMGDGLIELRRLRAAVDAAGYAGPIEVEVMNRALWAEPAGAVLARLQARFAQHVL